MVTKYGMSEALGKVAINYDDNGRSVSSETRNLVETEVLYPLLWSTLLSKCKGGCIEQYFQQLPKHLESVIKFRIEKPSNKTTNQVQVCIPLPTIRQAQSRISVS